MASELAKALAKSDKRAKPKKEEDESDLLAQLAFESVKNDDMDGFKENLKALVGLAKSASEE